MDLPLCNFLPEGLFSAFQEVMCSLRNVFLSVELESGVTCVWSVTDCSS